MMVACELAWLHKLLVSLGLHMERKLVIYCDNISNIYLAKNPIFYKRMKHIKIHYHFVREVLIDFIYLNM